MFELFTSIYKTDLSKQAEYTANKKLDNILNKAEGAIEFFKRFSGCSFNGGLYRIHKYQDIIKWNAIINKAYRGYSKYGLCFSYDWLGRQFALDFRRKKNNEPMILMLEPGTGEALQIPATFLSFHEEELIEYPDAAIAVKGFTEWMNIHKKNISNEECVGYKVPLYLGGKDAKENFELSDMEMYWEISAQLLEKTRNMPTILLYLNNQAIILFKMHL